MARKEALSSNAMMKSSLSFKTLPLVLSSHLKSATNHNCPGRSADLEETEGMSTPAEDLLIRNIWKHQPDCILDVRITNLDAPSNFHRKLEAVLLSMNAKRRRHTSKPAWTSAVTYVPLWCHVMTCLVMKPNNLAGNLAKKSGKSYSETSGSEG